VGGVVPDAAVVAEAAGGMRETGASVDVARDTGIAADLASPEDAGRDFPFVPDSALPPDVPHDAAAGGAAGTDARDGPARGGSDGPAGVGADVALAPMIISVDFVGGMPNNSGGATGTVVMDVSESAGVKPATHWNSATASTGTLGSLLASSGSVTPAVASWSLTPIDGATDTWSSGFVDAPGDTRMMNGYLDPRSANLPATITVTGLPDLMVGGYDVYVYCYSNMDMPDTRQYEYQIGAKTLSASQLGPSTSSFPGYTLAAGGDAGTAGNYVVFRNVTGSSFTLIAQPRRSTFSIERAPVNGFQIVFPSGY
jgi:hypothetical protein